ncbi:MAG TPA: BatD family protein [Arachidicoccus sp.]|nr:BatD family protein [Arachidicoccus sp.]
MYRWKFVLLIFLCGIGWQLAAQPAVSLHLSEKTIGSQDAVQATYEFKNISRPEMPDIDFKDWDVNGPSLSQSTSIINGNATSSVSYIFTLYPKHMGSLRVPGIHIDYNGKTLSCEDGIVKVSKQPHVKRAPQAGSSPFGGLAPNLPNMGFPSDIFGLDQDMAPPPITGVTFQPGQSFQDAAKNDFFIKITPSKTTFYVGEPILVDYEFMGAFNCSWQPNRFPSFNSFSVTDIEQNLYPYNVEVNGRRFRARGIRKVQLIALKTGDIPLDSASVSVQTTFIDATNHADRRSGTILVKSKPMTVHVIPLPVHGQPADFSGAIGQFKISASVDKNKLPAGENNILHVRITGTGNLDAVDLPTINWPSNIQAYDAKDSQSVNKSAYPLQKSLNFDVPFIGNNKGGVVIPSIVFNYFDTQKNAYVKDSTDQIQLEFTESVADNGVADSLARNHATNRNYLWIVACIALLVISILLITERKKWKESRKNKSTAQQAIIPMSATDAQRPIPAPAISSEGSHPNDPGIAADLKHMSAADQTRYLPPRLAQKMKTEALQKMQIEEAKEQENATAAAAPLKSRQELLAESIKELEEQSDPKEFFLLAKALLIQQLQDLLHLANTDEQQLLQALDKKDPEKTADFKTLITRCNKALYMPVTAAASRQEILTAIKALCKAL